MSTIKAADLFERQTIAPVMTDEQIAQKLGLSRARVFQIRLRAMAKIKAAVLADDELRDTVEELTGRNLPSVEPCATADCATPRFDVQVVAARQGRRWVGKSRMCRHCRHKSGGAIKVVK